MINPFGSDEKQRCGERTCFFITILLRARENRLTRPIYDDGEGFGNNFLRGIRVLGFLGGIHYYMRTPSQY